MSFEIHQLPPLDDGSKSGELNFRSDFLRPARDAPTGRVSPVYSRYPVYTSSLIGST